MDFELGGIIVQAGFPLDVTLLCVGLLAGYVGLVRKHGALMAAPGERPVTVRQATFFTSGVVLFWLADGWPVQALSEHLFSVHMVQHLLQALMIPALLLLGIPTWMGDLLLRNRRVRRVVQWVCRPVVAGLAWNAWLVATHSPQLVALQLDSPLFHAFDHLVLIGVGLAMFMPVWSPVPNIVPRLGELQQLFYLFLMTLIPTIPSSFLTFGQTPLYPAYTQVQMPWNIGVIDDMQVAGLLMKLGGGFFLWIVITVKYFRWAGAEERADRESRRVHAATTP